MGAGVAAVAVDNQAGQGRMEKVAEGNGGKGLPIGEFLFFCC